MISSLTTLAALWFVAVVTPGPNFIATVHRTASGGRREGLLVAAGIVAGTALWAAAGLFGLKALFALLPWAATALKTLGGLYLVWAGWTIWRNASRSGALPVAARGRRSFFFGFSTVLANPKTAAVASSLFAVALPADATALHAATALGLIIILPALWYSLVAMAVSKPRVLGLYEHVRKPVHRLTGGLFMLFGLKLVADR